MVGPAVAAVEAVIVVVVGHQKANQLQPSSSF